MSAPISYAINLKNENTIYVGAGPYFAYALSGKGKLKNTSGTINQDSWDLYSVDTYKRTDAGLTFQIDGTYESRFLISANIDVGLTDVVKLGGNKVKTIAAGISLGYLFRR